MGIGTIGRLGALAFGAVLLSGAPVLAETANVLETAAHAHEHEADDAVYRGHFDDDQIAERPLSDWEGDWRSVYPYLVDGTLDPVMEHKAAHGTKSAAEYRAYYETGYATDVDRIVIAGDAVTFYRGGTGVEGRYVSDGYEVLTYEAGNRGVRYVFKKIGGDEAAPAFIQFSDHKIAPEKSDHFHLYWGNDRAAILEELTNWPTYYPAALDGDAIVREMIVH